MVFMPPRHGKSELASVRFPAWFLGRNPDKKVIAASYGSGMAHKFSRRTRNLIASPSYQRLFPGVAVAGDAAAVQFWAIEGKDGQYNAAGVGGGITGEGADLLLIDDPVKDAEAATSLTIREGTWEWYVSTAYPRLNDESGAIILIQTRWHEDDLAGKLLQEAAEGGEQWHVIRLPAIADAHDPLGRAEGEPLWPARFSAQRLTEIRRTVGENWWSALYQQAPPEALGGRYFRSFAATKNGEPWHVWPISKARTLYDVPETREVQRAGQQTQELQPFPPREWRAWGSVDGGIRDAWCAHRWAMAPNGRIFVYAEDYGSNILIPDQAKRMRKRCAMINRSVIGEGDEHLALIKADPAMFNKRANIGVSDAHIYAQLGVPLTPAYNSRIMGWRRLLETLEPMDDGYPRLVILADEKGQPCAPNLVRTLPRLTADPSNPEDVEEGQEDHAADCARYGVNPAAAAENTLRRHEMETRLDPRDTREHRAYADMNQTGMGSEW